MLSNIIIFSTTAAHAARQGMPFWKILIFQVGGMVGAIFLLWLIATIWGKFDK
jgi:hypothetical protein